MNRERWKGFTRTHLSVTLILSCVVLSVLTPSAHAETFCRHDGHAKATLLFDNTPPQADTTGAEVRESGSWMTSGNGSACYGKGLFQQSHNPYPDSRCYTNDRAYPTGSWTRNSCTYKLGSTTWYTDAQGRARKTEMTYTIHGDFTRYEAGGGSSPFHLYARWKIRYDGQGQYPCWWDGTVPTHAYIRCTGGRSK
jgi:hypothetical protein